MKKIKKSVNDLQKEDFNEMMDGALKKKKVPLIKSEQINMRLTPDFIKVAKELAKMANKPVTTFLTELLLEDLERIWKLVK